MGSSLPTLRGVVVEGLLPPSGIGRTHGYVVIAAGGRRIRAWMSGVAVQWVHEGDRVRVEPRS